MKSYINIPKSVYCTPCRECGSRPVIEMFSDIGYVVKCPNNENHYHTFPGLIDIEDWNSHNKQAAEDRDFTRMIFV